MADNSTVSNPDLQDMLISILQNGGFAASSDQGATTQGGGTASDKTKLLAGFLSAMQNSGMGNDLFNAMPKGGIDAFSKQLAEGDKSAWGRLGNVQLGGQFVQNAGTYGSGFYGQTPQNAGGYTQGGISIGDLVKGLYLLGYGQKQNQAPTAAASTTSSSSTPTTPSSSS